MTTFSEKYRKTGINAGLSSSTTPTTLGSRYRKGSPSFVSRPPVPIQLIETPKVGIKEVASVPWNFIKEIATGLKKQYTEPSESVKQAEQILGYNSTGNKIQDIISAPLRTFAKGAIRTFGPMVEPIAKDIAQKIGIATDSYTSQQLTDVITGQMSEEEKYDLNLIQQSPLQTIGNIGQAVMAVYAPTKLFSAEGKTILGKMGAGALTGGQVGAEFGIAQALSSGSTNPAEISKIILQSTIGGSALGTATGGLTGSLQKISELKSKVKSPAIKEALNIVEGEIKIKIKNETPGEVNVPVKTEQTFGEKYRKTTVPPQPLAQEATSIAKAKASGQSFDEWVKGQGEPVFHGTNYSNARQIQQSGLNPETATSLKNNQKNIFLTGDEQYAKSYATQKGGNNSFVLSVKKPTDAVIEQSTFKKGMKNPDLISKQSIPPEDIIIKGKDGKWYPIKEFNFFTGEANTYIGKNPVNLKTRSQLKAEWEATKGAEVKPPTPKQIVQEAQAQELGYKPTPPEMISDRIAEEFAQEYGFKPNEIPTLEKTTFKNELAKATDLIANDPNKAYRVGMKLEKATDAESVATNFLLAKKAGEIGDFSLMQRLELNRKVAQSSRGQGIVLEKLASDNSMSGMLKDFYSYKLEKLGNRFSKGIDQSKPAQQKGAEILNRKTKEIKAKSEEITIPKEELSINKFLDNIVC